MFHLFVVLSPPPVLNCEICDLFKLWVNHSLVCMSSSFVPIHFVWFFFSFSQGFYKKKKKKYIYMDLLKSFLRCKFLSFVFSLWFMNTMLRFNHYMKLPAVKTRRKPGAVFPTSPQGKPCGSRMPVCFRKSHRSLHALFLSFLQKEVDPGDFSPCIKQETIINV